MFTTDIGNFCWFIGFSWFQHRFGVNLGRFPKDPALGIVTSRFWRSGLWHAVPIMSTLPWWQWKIHENPTFADDFPHRK